MNIRYPIYEGVYRILTMIVTLLFSFILFVFLFDAYGMACPTFNGVCESGHS